MIGTYPIAIAALLCAGVSFAQGSGSQIRGGPEVIAPKSPPQRADTKQCESLRDEAKARCIKEAIDKTESSRRSGPESTGMGSGAGTSSAPR
jgi:hypothetical protein